MKKGIVVANCQAKSLAQTLNFFSEDVNFEHFAVNSLSPNRAEKFITAGIEKFRDADIVLTFNLSDKFYGLSKAMIRTTFVNAQVFSITNLFFNGYHPDIIVLGEDGVRLDGLLAQYHSRVALYGYTRGFSVEETCRLFNAEVFRVLGYYEAWNVSANRMIAVDREVDLGFAERFAELARRRLCMYVVNHPTPVAFLEWARFLTGALDERSVLKLRNWAPMEECLPHHFSDTAMWPVYPEVAEHHGLAIEGSYMFKALGFASSSFFGLTGFVQREFDVFARVGPEGLEKSRQGMAAGRSFADLDAHLGIARETLPQPVKASGA